MYDPERTQRLFLKKCLLDKSGCWNWTGHLNDKGYSRFSWMINGEYGPSFGHRYSYERFIGKLKKHMTIDHLCKNKKCVNPMHLEQVTWKENLFRGDTISGRNAKKTHCKRGHEFTKENTRISTLRSKRKSGKVVLYKIRQCLQCEHSYYKRSINENRLLTL